MRLAYHIEVSKKAYILLFITAILHLFSIVFKQLVIQQVHTMRNLDQNISYNTIKVQTLRSNNEFLNDLHLIYYLNSANFLSELNELMRQENIILTNYRIYIKKIIFMNMTIYIFCKIYLKMMSFLNQLMLLKN